MTVGELIKALSEHDPDVTVYVRGYEAGVNDVASTVPVRVIRDYYGEDEWWNGAHQALKAYESSDGEPVTPGIHIVGGR